MSKNEYKFYVDWHGDLLNNSSFESIFKEKISECQKTQGGVVKILEVGSGEGQSTLWFIQNTNKYSEVYCVDTHSEEGWYSNENLKVVANRDADKTVYEVFEENILNRHPERVVYFRDATNNVIPKFSTHFDIIYIDGDHSSKGIIQDSIYCFDKLKEDGLIIYDDYNLESVKRSVDFFYSAYEDHITNFKTEDRIASLRKRVWSNE